MEVKNKEQWRRSNKTLAIEIAEITESFGRELADKWSNETSAVGSSEDNIGEKNYPYTLCVFFLLLFSNESYVNKVITFLSLF